MVDDRFRTKPLLRAVRSVVKNGDIVLDIGTGTGILAIAAAKAGASKVYAVDCDEAALASAMDLATHEGVSEKIEFVSGLSFDLKLPKKADVVLCETVGSFAFDENILATLLDAKRRLAKRGATIVPQRLELWAAPIGRVPKLRMPAEIAMVKRADLMSKPKMIAVVDFSSRFGKSVRAKARFTISKGGSVEAFAVWPEIVWHGKMATSASPLAKPTHWMQGILPVEHLSRKTCERVEFEMIVEPHPDSPLAMTERLWKARLISP